MKPRVVKPSSVLLLHQQSHTGAPWDVQKPTGLINHELLWNLCQLNLSNTAMRRKKKIKQTKKNKTWQVRTRRSSAVATKKTTSFQILFSVTGTNVCVRCENRQ